jgi:hypothetical protein
MKHRILAIVCSIAAALTASAQVPSLINYQGRLTDSNGAPVTGSKNFAISIYDAATGGNLLYEETIGAVTLDANGVYSFQFGSAGSSNTQVTETIGTTDGTTLTYSKALSNTPVVNNSVTVTDGTNSWSQSVGNPGVGATATANTISGFVIGATITNGGSGYTSAPSVSISGAGSGATATAALTNGVVTGITINSAGSGYTGAVTITIDPPVIPFRVDYTSGAITATYSTVPTSGQIIDATYRYTTSGIAGALGAGAEHWMAVNVDGVVQGTRQRILAVPFAQMASFAQSAMTASTAQTATSVDPRKNLRKVELIFSSTSVVDSSGSHVINLPYTRSGSAAAISGTKLIPSNVVKISKISGNGYAKTSVEGHSVASLSLMARSATGIVTSIASASTSGQDGIIEINGPLVLDHSNYEYYLEIEMGWNSPYGKPSTLYAGISGLTMYYDSY